MAKRGFCSECGTQFVSLEWPRKCYNCGTEAYQNAVLVGVLIQPVRANMERIGVVLIKRKIEPSIGELALPGGYVGHEDWRYACAREGKEEAGLVTDYWGDIEIFQSYSVPNSTIVLNFGIAPTVDYDTLPPFPDNAETSARIITFAPIPLAFPLHAKVLEEFFISLSRGMVLKRR